MSHLPHMQGSFSATVDEITWVVTTYLVAAGIMIPTTGWITGQFGRKRYFDFNHDLRHLLHVVRRSADPRPELIMLTFASYGMQILNPVFLQDLLGYTARKAGLAMAPRGLGVMASMFLLGGIARRGYDTRPLVAFGFLLIGAET